jgi:hypothetical protein
MDHSHEFDTSVNPDTTYTRLLRRAVAAAGNESKLAAELRTSPEVLGRWLAGEIQPPSHAYLRAIEIIVQAAGEWGAYRATKDSKP